MQLYEPSFYFKNLCKTYIRHNLVIFVLTVRLYVIHVLLSLIQYRIMLKTVGIKTNYLKLLKDCIRIVFRLHDYNIFKCFSFNCFFSYPTKYRVLLKKKFRYVFFFTFRLTSLDFKIKLSIHY